MKNLRKWIQKNLQLVKTFGTIGITVIILVAIFYATRSQAQTFQNTPVIKGDITEKVILTGQVKPVQSINFSFEKPGTIASTNVKVGDQVKSGQVLAKLTNDDAFAQVSQAQAGVELAQAALNGQNDGLMAQQAKLDDLQNGSQVADLNVSKTLVNNSKLSASDAKKALNSANDVASANLNSTLDSAINSASSAITSGNITVSSMIPGGDLASSAALNSAQTALSVAQSNPNYNNVINLCDLTKTALADIKSALAAVTPPTDPTLQANFITSQTNIDTLLSTISAKEKMIDTQNAANDLSVASAKSAVDAASGSNKSAKAQLNLKIAGATADQIKAQQDLVSQAGSSVRMTEAQLKQANANLAYINAQYAKTTIKSTLDGIVTQLNIDAGEYAAPGQTVVSVISNTQFQIEGNVAENDLAKVAIGNSADVTLDAYGPSQVFKAHVVALDPAQNQTATITGYKVTLTFDATDSRIKSGQTANVAIETASKTGVLTIPQNSIVRSGVTAFVLEGTNPQTAQKKQVQIGILGGDGQAEVTSGLNENDQIISFGKAN